MMAQAERIEAAGGANAFKPGDTNYRQRTAEVRRLPGPLGSAGAYAFSSFLGETNRAEVPWRRFEGGRCDICGAGATRPWPQDQPQALRGRISYLSNR
jgi:hypothetical protein